MAEKKNDKKALIMITVSMIIYGTIGIFRRYIPLPSAQLACCRGFVGATFLLIYVKATGKKFWHHISPKQLIMLVITGAMIGVNWILLFEAYNYTTVATATLCYYMQPTLLVIIAAVVFREKITPFRALSVIIGIIGMVLVSGVVDTGMPEASELHGIAYGLGAALLYALVIIMNKKLSDVDTYQETITELYTAAIVLIPYLFISGGTIPDNMGVKAIIMIAIVGLVHTGIAYALYFGSMDGLSTQSIGLLSYIDPVTALILSAIVLREHMTIYGIIGAVMILSVTIIGNKE